MSPPTDPADQPGQRRQMVDLKKVKDFLLSSLRRTLGSDSVSTDLSKKQAYNQLQRIYDQTHLQLSENTRNQLFREVMDELAGYGPLQPLLDDPEISDVMVNSPRRIFFVRNGKMIQAEIAFEDQEHIMRVIDRLISPLGKRLDRDHPTIDIRLADGSRLIAVTAPAASDGTSMTIHKREQGQLSIQDLIQIGWLTETTAEFLHACVVARLNIIISGLIGTGKTTLLNALSTFIPDDDRIVSIEEETKLNFQQENVVRLEARPADASASAMPAMRDLIHICLGLQPDRIVIDELHRGEALGILAVMNANSHGSLTTLQANDPWQAIAFLENMAVMAEPDLPRQVLREQITSAVDLIVQQTHMSDGSRKVTQICEISGMEGDSIVLSDIFQFEQTGLDPDGMILGELKPTGIRPLFSKRLEDAGFRLKSEFFGMNIVEMRTQNNG